MTCLTFIIPIRHQDCSDNWDVLLKNLSQTVKSICAQTCDDWKCVIVANKGADLPDFPDGFDVCLVDYPPNNMYAQEDQDIGSYRDAVRLDKGKRILSGIRHSEPTHYFMFVDDDDLIHRDLVKYVCDNAGEGGWYINKGLVWQDGSGLLMKYSQFYMLCGTSHIVSSRLLDFSGNEVNIEYVKRMLGSHIHLKGELDKTNTPLRPLPFRGAIYRIGHADAHSKIGGIYRTFFTKRRILKHPLETIVKLLSLRKLTKKTKAMYFGT